MKYVVMEKVRELVRLML